MAHTATMQKSKPEAAALGGNFPLPLATQGAPLQVVALRTGTDEAQKHHLQNLGFVQGAPASVVCRTGNNLIAEVKGARIALCRQIAMRILVAPCG